MAWTFVFLSCCVSRYLYVVGGAITRAFLVILLIFRDSKINLLIDVLLHLDAVCFEGRIPIEIDN
jgi:hypothetical protein